MLRNLFRRSDSRPTALYEAAVAQARQPAFYTVLGVPDTLDGRFDMLILHLSALIDRFRNPDRSVSEPGQALFDLFVNDMDDNLRQMGIGDLSVPKKMNKIGQSFYGRFGAYTRAGDRGGLADAIGRNVFPEDGGPGEGGTARPAADALAGYFLAMRAALSGQHEAALLEGRVDWPPVPDINERGEDGGLPDQAVETSR